MRKAIFIIAAFLVALLGLAAIIFRFSYRGIVDSEYYLEYPAELEQTSSGKTSFTNLQTGSSLKKKYTKSLCCRNCQCDPARYVSVYEDRKEGVYWIAEYEMGIGAASCFWYGPFYSSYFKRLSFAGEDKQSKFVTVLQNQSLTVKEKKISEPVSLYELDISSVDRVSQVDEDDKDDFDCEWEDYEDGQICFSDADKKDTYIKKKKVDEHFIQIEIVVDNKLQYERKVGIDIGNVVEAVRWIEGNFVVDLQGYDSIIRCSSRGEVCGDGTILAEDYFSTIIVNGGDRLAKREYREAFSPKEIDGKLAFFFSGNESTFIYFNNDSWELPYTEIVHYGCCWEKEYDVVSNGEAIDFFAKKDDGWYNVRIVAN